MIFKHGENEHIIRLIESKKPIISDSGKTETSETNINGIPVIVGNKPKKKRKHNDEYSFAECNWKYGDIYFNYRSDLLTAKQIEQVIASMIEKSL
jgi:hypothetical protein